MRERIIRLPSRNEATDVEVWHFAETPLKTPAEQMVYEALVAARRREEISYTRISIKPDDSAGQIGRLVTALRSAQPPDVILAPEAVHADLRNEVMVPILDPARWFDRNITNAFVHTHRGRHVSLGYDGSLTGLPGAPEWDNWATFVDYTEGYVDFMENNMGEALDDEYFDTKSRLAEAGYGNSLIFGFVAGIAASMIGTYLYNKYISEDKPTNCTCVCSPRDAIPSKENKQTGAITPIVKDEKEDDKKKSGDEDKTKDEEKTKDKKKGGKQGLSGEGVYDLLLIVNEIAEQKENDDTWKRIENGTPHPEDFETIEEFKDWLAGREIESEDLIKRLENGLPMADDSDPYAMLYWIYQQSYGKELETNDYAEYVWAKRKNIDPIDRRMERGIVYVGGIHQQSEGQLHLSFQK